MNGNKKIRGAKSLEQLIFFFLSFFSRTIKPTNVTRWSYPQVSNILRHHHHPERFSAYIDVLLDRPTMPTKVLGYVIREDDRDWGEQVGNDQVPRPCYYSHLLRKGEWLLFPTPTGVATTPKASRFCCLSSHEVVCDLPD